jgi:hypothetical protein
MRFSQLAQLAVIAERVKMPEIFGKIVTVSKDFIELMRQVAKSKLSMASQFSAGKARQLDIRIILWKFLRRFYS